MREKVREPIGLRRLSYMHYFNNFTDFMQRIWFWGIIISSSFTGIDWYTELSNSYLAFLSFSIAVILLVSRFFIWIKDKVKDRRKPTQSETNIEEIKPVYIPFKEAIKIIADCGYYDFNGHDKMNEAMGVTRQSYYRELKKRNLFIWA